MSDIENCLMCGQFPPETNDFWQPIETAPKDDTRVIVYGSLHGSKYNEKNRRWEAYNFGKQVTQAYFYASIWQTGRDTTVKATHWMPLPSKPKEISDD